MNRLTQLQRTLYIIHLLAEGGVVLAHQVVAPKILEPVFGNSVVVWSAVLVCTLVGLSIGYVLGDRAPIAWEKYARLGNTSLRDATARSSTPLTLRRTTI